MIYTEALHPILDCQCADLGRDPTAEETDLGKWEGYHFLVADMRKRAQVDSVMTPRLRGLQTTKPTMPTLKIQRAWISKRPRDLYH